MNQEFTIDAFIHNRWAEARQELARRDPSFISTVEAHDYLVGKGFVLPRTIPIPKHRLPARWHQLLETTMEIMQELERLHLTVSLVEPVPASKETPDAGRRIGRYFCVMWVQNAHNLCDKVKLLVTHSCRLFLEDSDKVKYHQDIEAKLQNRLEALRHPLVHGAGGQGTTAKQVFTVEQQGWEICVAFGPEIINHIMSAAHAQGMTRKDHFEGLKGLTDFLIKGLAQTLHQLDQEITQAKTA